METYMQKLLQVLRPASKNQPVPKIKIEEQELFEIQELFLDFSNLVSYENNKALKSSKTLKKAIENSLFLRESYAVGTPQCESLLVQHKELKDLELGESFSKQDFSMAQICHNELHSVFKKDGNLIRKYTQIMPFYNRYAQYVPAYNFVHLQRSKGTEQEGDILYVENPGQNEKATCFIEGDKMVVLGYDIRRNPFSKKHFRVFDENGEIQDLSSLNYVHLIRRIRDAEAHHKVYSYFNGKPYGGKVVPLGKGKAALFSNRWHEFLIQTGLMSLSRLEKEFHVLCVPHSQKSIRTDKDCVDKIDSIRKITVKTKEEINSTYAYGWLNKIIENYENSPTKNKTFEEYLQAQVTKCLGEANCKIEPLENTQLLKSRLVGDLGFYNIFTNEKDNALMQERFIKHLIGQVYENSYTTNDSITTSGKTKPVHVDMQDLSLFLSAELPRLQHFTGVVKGSKHMNDTAVYASVEKQIVVPLLCAYKNLIRSHFIDDMVEYANYPAGFALSGKLAEDKRALGILDMKIFEVYKQNHKGAATAVQTFEQKSNVLRALRNAISHNQMYVQFNKNCDISESKYVFDIGEYSKVRVNIEKFYDFINQPLFADYKSSDKYTIKAQNVEELKEFIKKICKNERIYGRDKEFGEE